MTGFLDEPGPRWFTIPPHRPFAEDLARGVLEAVGREPEALAEVVLLTPTRRAGREVAHAFLTAGGPQASLLPQIRPLGDLDEGEPPFEPGDLTVDLPAAISPWRRRFELARLVKAHERRLGRDLDAAGALAYADALGRFLDSCFIEERCDPAALDGLGGDFAAHWEISREFLCIALVTWRARLAELGVMDVAERRIALLRRLAEHWGERPPPGVMIAAGSTGTAPSTGALLAAIAAAPRGAVVLPGLDMDLSDRAWNLVGEPHPQGSMKRLLATAEVDRAAVQIWPRSRAPDARARWRRRLISEALKPADGADDWVEQVANLREESRAEGVDAVSEGLKGLSLIVAKAEDEAASVAALLLRETLETPGATAALVTPDLGLARRVSARLSRWGVETDTSAGSPLAGAPAAVLAVEAVRTMLDPAAPASLLALLKSPLTRLGRPENRLWVLRRRLERAALRGARPRTLDEIKARLGRQKASADLVLGLLDNVTAALAPLSDAFAGGPALPADAARGLAMAMERLAALPGRGGTGTLWSGAAGEAMSGILAALIEDGGALPPVSRSGFLRLIESLVDAESVRAAANVHPRLRILGAIEARLVRADRLILAGLEEGVWPAGAGIDPFLSRPMRETLGLPPPERRVGLAAHDFAQAANAPEVILLRSERRAGAPAVASRWLWRLETLIRGAGEGAALPGRPDVLAWARALDAPLDNPPPELLPAAPPQPRPPLHERPRELSVTRIEDLVRDPYQVYARYVLKLTPLDPPDAPADARIRGTAIHKALEAYGKAWPPEGDAAGDFIARYMEALAEAGMPEASLTRERALAKKAGAWVAAWEQQRRAGGAEVRLEAKGQAAIETGGPAFTLTAKADRIEVADGRVHVIDFKTGRAPEKGEVHNGFSPQLTLTALIVALGGFEGVDALPPGDLTYVRLTGREPPGEAVVRGPETAKSDREKDSAALVDDARAGLIDLIRRYDDPSTPYPSRIAPARFAAKGEDYDHLARVREWSTAEDEDE